MNNNIMEQEKEMCRISISERGFDNQYVFYEDGKINKIDDKGVNSDLPPEQISGKYKDLLVKNCKEEFKEDVMLILNYP